MAAWPEGRVKWRSWAWGDWETVRRRLGACLGWERRWMRLAGRCLIWLGSVRVSGWPWLTEPPRREFAPAGDLLSGVRQKGGKERTPPPRPSAPLPSACPPGRPLNSPSARTTRPETPVRQACGRRGRGDWAPCCPNRITVNAVTIMAVGQGSSLWPKLLYVGPLIHAPSWHRLLHSRCGCPRR